MTAIRAVCFDAFGTLESGDWLVPSHRDAATGIRMEFTYAPQSGNSAAWMPAALVR